MNPAGGFLLFGIIKSHAMKQPQTPDDLSRYRKGQGKICEDAQGTKGERDETK